jgi:hydrogenase nickel incorporation protein HypA/HybF
VPDRAEPGAGTSILPKRGQAMHELGIVFHISDSVEKIAQEHQISHVDKVVLEIGEVSLILHDYLVDCWNWNAKRNPLFAGCTLEIETIPAITYCEDCGEQYPTVAHGRICPRCHGEHTYLIQGNEALIREIVVEDEAGDAGEI